jgi:hypothetical protein
MGKIHTARLPEILVEPSLFRKCLFFPRREYLQDFRLKVLVLVERSLKPRVAMHSGKQLLEVGSPPPLEVEGPSPIVMALVW